MNKAIWRNDKPLGFFFFELEECSCTSLGRTVVLEEPLLLVPVEPAASVLVFSKPRSGGVAVTYRPCLWQRNTLSPFDRCLVICLLDSQPGPWVLRGRGWKLELHQQLLLSCSPRVTSVFVTGFCNFRKIVFTGIKSAREDMVEAWGLSIINCFVQLNALICDKKYKSNLVKARGVPFSSEEFCFPPSHPKSNIYMKHFLFQTTFSINLN